jgi:pSer/pThr/pTyr-binding forkhead associated (FHA) protein
VASSSVKRSRPPQTIDTSDDASAVQPEEDSSMHAYLRIVSGPDAGRTIDVTEGVKMTIGRGEKSDTRLTDLGVSRLHCEILWQGSKFHLVDLGSAAGTQVEGKPIQECDLKHDQEFQIGGTRLKLHTTGISDAQTLLAAQRPTRELTPDEAVLTGTKISHYEIGPLVAKGRTGTVYKSRDSRDGKDVAVKVMHSGFTSDEEDVQRFIRAMTTAVELRHPNLIALYGAGKQGDKCWLAMEYVDGEPLTKTIERIGTLKMLEWRFALLVGVHIAQALEAAHEKHIIHRNVAPESILIRTQDKVAKLGDMMLAKALEGVKAKQITRPGELVGDLAYMAPERTKSDVEVDTRADIYGLGATLYALLTGKPPFEGKTLVETIAQIRQSDPVPPKKFQLSIPDKFQDAVMVMLAKRPELRYQTPAQAARALEQVAKYQGMQF